MLVKKRITREVGQYFNGMMPLLYNINQFNIFKTCTATRDSQKKFQVLKTYKWGEKAFLVM